MIQTAPAPPRIGRLHRLRLLHPCRFFAYGWMLLLVLALLVVGAVSGEWRGVALAVLALVFTVPGIEAAARSTVGPAEVLTAYRKAQNL